MKIRLKALSDVSGFTGGKKAVRGDIVDVTKAKAAEAVKTGRWEEAIEEQPANEDGAEK